MIPDWLASASGASAPFSRGAPRFRRLGFIRDSLEDLGRFFRDAFLSKGTADRPGFLQSLDPGIKLVTILGWVVVTTLVARPDVLAGICGAAFILALCSNIPIGRFATRAGIAPLLTGFFALPAALNVITPGEPLWTLMRWHDAHAFGPWVMPEALAFTRQGLLSVGLLTLRVASALAWISLLVLTTRWERVLHALRVLRFPVSLLATIEMMYRYIYLLIRHMVDTHLAMQSRTVRSPSFKVGQQMAAVQMGVLLRKSVHLSDEIYEAMCSRGYTGDIHFLELPGRLKALDFLWLAGSVSLAASAFWLSSAGPAR